MAERFEEGDMILIPCESQVGAFPHELVILVNTGERQFLGFVRKQHTLTKEGKDYLYGQVKRIGPSTMQVKTRASFFTTASGMTELPARWIEENARRQEEQVA